MPFGGDRDRRTVRSICNGHSPRSVSDGGPIDLSPATSRVTLWVGFRPLCGEDVDGWGREAVSDAEEFRDFVREVEPRLRRALVAACGTDAARDAVQEALIYGWRHWDRIREMDNSTGYLYRVARSRVHFRRTGRLTFPPVHEGRLPEVEPELPRALARLTERQRVAVFLVEGCDWTYAETAELMGVSVSTVRNHLRRGMSRLRTMLGVTTDA